MTRKKKRIAVAMSGGVDSSVAAALMKDQGFEVIGITLQLYDHGVAVERKNTCCAGRDIHDARNVAAHLGIAHYVLDFESRFRRDVIDSFADSYLKGETPLPCVRCNQSVKFRDLLSIAKDFDACALVTGHYVRRDMHEGKPILLRGKDQTKDQSYFLFATTEEQLEFLRFPLGDKVKSETRLLAKNYGLPVAEKSDSQDICFVPEGNYRDILLKLRPEASQAGNIVDQSGRVLGRHQGIAHYTVGQRRGLGLGGTAEPLYVLALRPDKAEVLVGPFDSLGRRHIMIKEVNWLGEENYDHETRVPETRMPETRVPKTQVPKTQKPETRKPGIPVLVKCRSTMPPVAGRFFHKAGHFGHVVLEKPHQAIAPGQACVLYQEERLMGGGWIMRDDDGDHCDIPPIAKDKDCDQQRGYHEA